LYAFDHSEQPEEISRVLKQIAREQLMTRMSDGARQAVLKLLEYIESDQGSQTFLAAVSYLIEKVGLEPLFSTNMLARMYHARGYTYGVLEEYQRTIHKYDHTDVSVLDLLPGLYNERADAYAAIEEDRKGMVCASLGRDIEAMAALEYALVLGMPPILLLRLRWLENTRPDFYIKYVVSVLTYR